MTRRRHPRRSVTVGGLEGHALFDNFVRPLEHRQRDRQAQGLRRFEVDHKLEPRRPECVNDFETPWARIYCRSPAVKIARLTSVASFFRGCRDSGPSRDRRPWSH